MKYNTNILFSDIKKLVDSNLSLKSTFRYYDSRDESCFSNHFYHFILSDPNPVGYGHLDYEDGKMWLGMCVFDDYVGKGYGKSILKILIDNRKNHIINLTVDKDNFKAINLYLSNGFRIYKQTEKIFYCNLI
jgi:RimJ/RimL family protein N-acetyltransferase